MDCLPLSESQSVMTELLFDITIRHKEFELTTQFKDHIRILAITGRSGIGKTSLLNALAGLVTPISGQIALNGEIMFDAENGINLPPHRRHIGYVFQDSRLFPHMTVAHNLDYAAYLARGRASVMDRSRLIDLLGLATLMDRYPAKLSGGEQQRVAIARALLSAPNLLLLDEPLSAIDKARRETISAMLLELKREISVPMILVSHNTDDIARLSDARLSLESGET